MNSVKEDEKCAGKRAVQGVRGDGLQRGGGGPGAGEPPGYPDL